MAISPNPRSGVGSDPWIKMRIALWDDPRVCSLCDALGTDEARVVGGLFRLWSIADSHSTDGFLPGMTKAAVDRKTCIPGFADALELIAWLLEDDGGLRIPDFEVHNGQSAKKRAQNTRRQQKLRSNGSVADLSRNDRDESATREEKKGEEQSRRDETGPAPSSDKVTVSAEELAETPLDGPSGVPETDAMQLVIDWNSLAEQHSETLQPHGQITLSRFDREAFANRIAAGTWHEDWRLFRQALQAARVKSVRVSLKKVLQGEILDTVAHEERNRRARKSKQSARPERPAVTALIEQREKVRDLIARVEAKGNLQTDDIEKLTRYRQRESELENRIERRKSESPSSKAGNAETLPDVNDDADSAIVALDERLKATASSGDGVGD